MCKKITKKVISLTFEFRKIVEQHIGLELRRTNRRVFGRLGHQWHGGVIEKEVVLRKSKTNCCKYIVD